MNSKLFRKSNALLISLIFLLSLESGCTKQPETEDLPTVIVYPVIKKDLHHTIDSVGQVVSIEDVFLMARVTGFLTTRNFNPGDYVKKGQLLFQIQKDQYKAQYENAQANLFEAQAKYDNALIEFNRLSLLLKQNAASQQSLDNATQEKLASEGVLLGARAQLELQALNLSYTDIYAPFDGRIGMYAYSVGNLVNENSNPLAEVLMIDPIWVEFPLSETKLIDFMKAHKNVLPTITNTSKSALSELINVKLKLSNGDWYDLYGDIDFINNMVNPLAGTIQLRAVFKNPNELLVPGAFVTVSLESKAVFPELLIFQRSMQEDQGGTFVFIVNKDNIAEKRYIKKGRVTDTQIEVTDGLEEGEMIIVDGLMRVRPMMKVIPTQDTWFEGNTASSVDTSLAADTQK